MPSHNTYCPTWVSLTLSLLGCSSKAQLLLTLDEGYRHTAAPSDLERGVAPLGPPASTQLLLLGGRVAPLGHCPELGHGEAPLGRRPCER